MFLVAIISSCGVSLPYLFASLPPVLGSGSPVTSYGSVLFLSSLLLLLACVHLSAPPYRSSPRCRVLCLRPLPLSLTSLSSCASLFLGFRLLGVYYLPSSTSGLRPWLSASLWLVKLRLLGSLLPRNHHLLPCMATLV